MICKLLHIPPFAQEFCGMSHLFPCESRRFDHCCNTCAAGTKCAEAHHSAEEYGVTIFKGPTHINLVPSGEQNRERGVAFRKSIAQKGECEEAYKSSSLSMSNMGAGRADCDLLMPTGCMNMCIMAGGIFDRVLNEARPAKRPHEEVSSPDNEPVSKQGKPHELEGPDTEEELCKKRANKFLEEIRKHLKCSICMEQVKTPVVLLCEHHFCRDCITKWLHLDEWPCPREDSKCPLCNSPIMTSTITTLGHLETVMQNQLSDVDRNLVFALCHDDLNELATEMSVSLYRRNQPHFIGGSSEQCLCVGCRIHELIKLVHEALRYSKNHITLDERRFNKDLRAVLGRTNIGTPAGQKFPESPTWTGTYSFARSV